MASRLFFILLVMASPALAEDKPLEKPAEAPAVVKDKPTEEPDALVAARIVYEAKAKEGVDPLKADYLKKLDGMKKNFGAKGDTVSALAVEREIKSLALPDTVSIAGKWSWCGGNVVEFKGDGTGSDRDGNTVKWLCIDKRLRKYQVVWSQGYDDLLLQSPDGSTLSIASYKRGGGVAYFSGRALPPLAKEKTPEKPVETSAVAGNKPVENPPALVKARNAYEDKIKLVVDPAKTDYLKKLESMKKDFGAKGDVASALVVEREIKSVSLAGTASIIGKWLWLDGNKDNAVEFRADGTANDSYGSPVKWLCLDKKARKYQSAWPVQKLVVGIQIASDGFTLDIVCHKHSGGVYYLTALRLPEP